MTFPRFSRAVRPSLLTLLSFSLLSVAHAQGSKKTAPETPIADADADHVEERSEWFLRGRVVPGKSSAGDGFQDYHQVSGRATAVAIDPADPTGNTVYIGGAQGGVWKSTNAATTVSNNVTWTAVTDDQATLSIGSIVIQPGNTDSAQSVVLVGTGECPASAHLFHLSLQDFT